MDRFMYQNVQKKILRIFADTTLFSQIFLNKSYSRKTEIRKKHTVKF